MKKYCLKHLPHWVLTDPQPAFYDCESATAVQQTAKIYAKIQELITLYNEFTNQVNRYITEFEDGIIKDFNCFQNCIIKTMNDYIATIDMKIDLQDNKIEESINNQNAIIQNAIDYMKNNIVQTTTTVVNQAIANGDIQVTITYDEPTEGLNIIITEGDGE